MANVLDWTIMLSILVVLPLTIEWNLSRAAAHQSTIHAELYMGKCLQYRTRQQCLNMLGLLGVGTNYFPIPLPIYIRR